MSSDGSVALTVVGEPPGRIAPLKPPRRHVVGGTGAHLALGEHRHGLDPGQGAPRRPEAPEAEHRSVQRFFLANGGPSSDPHRLDCDHDGITCESI
jgi:hypothetical protein